MLRVISVIPLSSSAPVSEVGYKAWTLMQLHHGLFRIRRGFVVPTAHFKGWIARSWDLESVPQSLRVALQGMIEELDLHYPLIARSSATVEDAPDRSWAGIFTSILHIENVNQLIEAILQIYRHARDPEGRVAQYNQVAGVKVDDIGMAVIVQEQLQPDMSGLLFTQNPLTGKEESVVEYVLAPPWELVSGATDANRITFPDGSEIPEKWAFLIQMGKEIALYFQKPQDIEWAIKEGEITILQARPITTLNLEAISRAVMKHFSNEVILKGTPASLGSQQDACVFIYDDMPVKEAERVIQRGQVVITLVLFPEYFGALSKAGAIVAQADTINCHVAILARELGIPCVVGINVKELSRFVREGDLIFVDGTEGTVRIPRPKPVQLGIVSQAPLWGFDKSDRYTRQQDILDALINCTRMEDASKLKKEIQTAYELLFQIAAQDPNRARSLYHDLSAFMQDIFVEVLQERYSMDAMLEAFSRVDKRQSPQNAIETLYAIIKEYINKHDSLRFQGRPFWEL